MSTSRRTNLTNCALVLDEALERLIRWDGETLDDVARVQDDLHAAREAILEAAVPELTAAWRAQEELVRAFEDDPEFSPWGNDEYDDARSAMVALFREIYEQALAS